MLGFLKDILPTADGCHPSINIGTQSNKFTGTTTDGETMLTGPSFDDEQEDDNDDHDDDNPTPS